MALPALPDISRELTADAGRSLQPGSGAGHSWPPSDAIPHRIAHKPRGGIKEMAAKKAMPKKKAKKK